MSSGPLILAQEESKGWRQWSASWGLSSDVKEVLTPSETAGTSSDPIAETRLLARKLRTFQSGALLRGSVSGLQWVKPYSVLPAGWRCPYISFSVCTWYLEGLVTGLHLSPRMRVLSYHFYFSVHFLMPVYIWHCTMIYLEDPGVSRWRQPWPLGCWRELKAK